MREMPATRAIDQLYLELSQFAKATTNKEYELQSLLRQAVSAGVSVLNNLGCRQEFRDAVQVERVEFYKTLNKVADFFGEPQVNPDLSKNDDFY
jgi:hypothetical protein